MSTNIKMECFTTKSDLIKAYAINLQYEAKRHYGADNGEHTDYGLFMETARLKCIYVPHIYNGGWFIPAFGYSSERVPTLGHFCNYVCDIDAMENYK